MKLSKTGSGATDHDEVWVKIASTAGKYNNMSRAHFPQYLKPLT
ncbi:hypothetical protein [Moorena sp. SIO3H5]|nr:hypothetical protein [Moorena sp. SIO3H5]